ncbi:hypothetical protein vBAbaPP1_119 [Acinetobacter phage vB_AbaM_P1]|nr:hypothetical protein vBAbaPP1_119 [Acinetobacter phage vB_AbaM_P1]WAX22600.1 hypothetical protein [Acinetobacter phage vB_AbaP_HB01]
MIGVSIGVIGGRGAIPSMAAIAATMSAKYGEHEPRSVRFTYKDEEGELSRAFSSDSIPNRHTFIELLQMTEYCYQESDIQKFLAYKHQNAIIVENI